MHACALTATGGLEHVAAIDLPAPRAPGPGEVRVALRAAAVNHLDLFVARGLPGITHTLPHVMGADGAGVVDAVGDGVRNVRPGDPVMINPGIADRTCEFCRAGEHSLCVAFRLLGEHLPGTFAEAAVVPAPNVVRVPALDPPLSWAEAAAFSLATLTAWRMLVTRARVQRGERVLVWGIGGGVALAAMRIAVLRGARVIATSGSDAKLARARELGAEVTLNHRTHRVADQVRALTGKRGVDVVVDNVGEATWQDSLRSLVRGGRLVTCGATSGPHVATDARRLFWHQYTVLGSTMGNDAEYRDAVGALAGGALRPVVDRVYPLAEGRGALARVAAGEQLGKVCLDIDRGTAPVAGRGR